jgi:hypothetical protein
VHGVGGVTALLLLLVLVLAVADIGKQHGAVMNGRKTEDGLLAGKFVEARLEQKREQLGHGSNAKGLVAKEKATRCDAFSSPFRMRSARYSLVVGVHNSSAVSLLFFSFKFRFFF